MKKAVEHFPLLREFARGYLHEDLLAEYGDVITAANTYLSDLGAAEREKLGAESRAFLAAIREENIAELNARLRRMGSSWSFGSAEEFERVLRLFDHGH